LNNNGISDEESEDPEDDQLKDEANAIE